METTIIKTKAQLKRVANKAEKDIRGVVNIFGDKYEARRYDSGSFVQITVVSLHRIFGSAVLRRLLEVANWYEQGYEHTTHWIDIDKEVHEGQVAFEFFVMKRTN